MEKQVSIDLISIVNMMGAIHAIFLAVFLFFNKRGNRKANRVFSIVLAILAVSILDSMVLYTKLAFLFPYLLYISNPMGLALPPLIYFYAKFLTSKNTRLKKTDLLHFIPFLSAFLFFAVTIYFRGTEFKLNLLVEEYAAIERSGRYAVDMATIIANSLAHLQVFIYYVLSLRLIKRYSQRISNYFSSVKKIDLKWAQFLFIGLMVNWLFSVLVFISMSLGYNPHRYANQFLFFLSTVFIYILGYMGLNRPDKFVDPTFLEYIDSCEKKESGQQVSETDTNKILDRMEREKVFQDPDLTLTDLSRQTAIPVRRLSQLINKKFKQNFSSFVNGYRVEEAKKIISTSNKKNYNILEVAFEVGFNSKSAFNAAFKKHTHMAPSQYRKSQE